MSLSWGNYPHVEPKTTISPSWTSELRTLPSAFLPHGCGRSYGDSCLSREALLQTTRLNRFIAFDREHGILRAEAGITFAEVLNVIVPAGWFLPVTPGTKFVTLGGAIANDVHGKNHHVTGTIGCHVRSFELIRSTGERFTCSPTEKSDFFRATIGGLGLTGVISWAEIQLIRIPGPGIKQETVPFGSLKDFFTLTQESDSNAPYTVAWLQTTKTGSEIGGLFYRGSHTDAAAKPSKLTASVPFFAPNSLLNRASISLFNTAYELVGRYGKKESVIHYEPFFYPLDAVHSWNKLYGKRGFLQYQCVIPLEFAEEALPVLYQRMREHHLASFLSVLKIFGDKPSPGFLSFPRPGVTLAVDVPFQGEKTLRALNALDEIVYSANGRLYPAKDARMSKTFFLAAYPAWNDMPPFLDPAISSAFIQRVTQ